MKYTLTLNLYVANSVAKLVQVQMQMQKFANANPNPRFDRNFLHKSEKFGCNEIHINPNRNLNPMFNPNFLNKSRKMWL